MEDIEIKSIATLIDALVTVSQSCWHAQDLIMDESLTKEKRFEAALRAQRTNKKRCELMRAIDRRLGEANLTVADKTY